MAAHRWGPLLLAPLIFVSSGACGGRTPTRADEPVDAGADAEPEPEPTELRESAKLDVLFVIDNSRSAHFAHAALSQTIPYFLDRLEDPPCVNGLGQVVDTPVAGAACARGVRDFAPLRDVHIGVISSSLGGHGADTCSPAGGGVAQENDRAELLMRAAGGGVVPTYAGLGFLAWDPNQTQNPPGDSDRVSYENKLVEIVDGVGSVGCDLEAPLEAFYRFLIDPAPFGQMVIQAGNAVPSGVNQLVLEQRASFLRPDSAVLIVIVSDEDDCSIIDGGQNYLAAQGGGFHLPRARAICASDPDDVCCTSCDASPPAGCAVDPTCAGPGHDDTSDPLSLRCFDQKRRFGVDFLQPLDRYVDGLTQREIVDGSGNVQPNPLFAGARSPSMITVAAITGVPWQDIALSPSSPASGFVPPTEVVWSRVLADGSTPPADPLMQPSREPRTGTHPITGDALAPPTAASADENPINGHEHALPSELQYACIYALAEARTCADPGCACSVAAADTNPVCQQEDGSYGALQRFGRATPATRQLELVRALPKQSALASICTVPSTDVNDAAFGYKPAVDAMLRTLRRSLVKPDPL